MLLRTKLLLFAVSSFLIGCASTFDVLHDSPANSEQLEQVIRHHISDTTFNHAHWGIHIENLSTGRTIFLKNEKRMFVPASNVKIPTTAAAYLELGPDFQFETRLYTDGEIRDSVLYGNLYVRSNGDPSLYTRLYDDHSEIFYDWARYLKALGIHEIKGNIVADASAFDEERIGFGWSHSGLDVWYSAPVGPLQWNENALDLVIIPPGSTNESAQIFLQKPTAFVTILDQTVISDTSATRIRVNRTYGTNEIVISGTIQAGADTLYRYPSIFNPELFYATVLTEHFEDAGIAVSVFPVAITDTTLVSEIREEALVLHTHFSPRLHELLKVLMKDSQNLYAETIPRVMAYQQNGFGTFDEGAKIVEAWLDSMGIAPESYRYRDGSGLSRFNLFSPSQFVTMLSYMYAHDLRDYWLESFPTAGVDGTLRLRMRGSSAENNVRAKTGTLSHKRGLSGYVQSASGDVYAFSFVINGYLTTASETDRITDSILAVIAAYEGH